MATTNTNLPQWLRECSRSFQASEAHMFLLYGDVDGYAVPGMSQRRYLTGYQAKRDRVVVRFDRANGITFPYDVENNVTTHRDEARRLYELATTGGRVTAAPAANNPMAQILNQLAPTPGAGNTEDPFEGATRVSDAFPILETLLRAVDPSATAEEPGSVCVVIDYLDTLLPAADKGQMTAEDRTLLVQLLTWAKDDGLAQRGNPVFLLATRLTEIHPDLRTAASGVKVVEIKLPDREARYDYLTWYLADRAENDDPIVLDATTPEELANITAGLSLRHLENILLLGAASGAVTYALVKAAKDEIISSEYTDVAEMVEPLAGGFSALGGIDNLVEWSRAEVIEPLRSGRSFDAPKGVLLVGPPGTGKTMFVRALAAELGFNCVSLRSENILGGIVGESERKLKQFFGFVRAMFPAVVFVDEIDQSDMSRRGNGSGNPVAANLFNQMLQFMSDETLRGRVVVIFASNRPDLLDPALLRFGRMDAIIPVLLPDAPARQQIATAQARTQGTTISPVAAAFLADRTDKYSAADIAAVVAKARKLARREGAEEINTEQVSRALAMVRPQTPDMADYYTRLAISVCNDTEFLPPNLAALLENREKLVEETREPAILNRRTGRREAL